MRKWVTMGMDKSGAHNESVKELLGELRDLRSEQGV